MSKRFLRDRHDAEWNIAIAMRMAGAVFAVPVTSKSGRPSTLDSTNGKTLNDGEKFWPSFQ